MIFQKRRGQDNGTRAKGSYLDISCVNTLLMIDGCVQKESLVELEENDMEEEEAEVSDIDSNAESSVEESSDDFSDSEVSHRKRSRKQFVAPPPRDLPKRTTRGKRMGALSVPDDDDADEEFWNQEFFAEEERDDAYETESEPEDKFDADFLDSEEEEEEDEDENEANALAAEPKKKVLKPPGYKKPPVKKVASKKSVSKPVVSDSVQIIPERTMSVRNSTRQKVEEAEEIRKVQEELKPKKMVKQTVQKQLTQAELLAEAARTEIENTRSLQYMEAIEEENKRKATTSGGKYIGPMISIKSVKNKDGFEQTTVEIKNMAAPDYLQPKQAPEVPEKDICPITKAPAKYRDPLTGTPYATLEAFKILRSQWTAS